MISTSSSGFSEEDGLTHEVGTVTGVETEAAAERTGQVSNELTQEDGVS